MKITIRKTQKSDIEQIVELGNIIWRDTYSHIMSNEVFNEKEQHKEETIEIIKNLINTKGRFGFVAEINRRIVGFATAFLTSNYEYYKNLGYADLEALYVSVEHQRCGIGKMLFDRIVAEFKKLGIQKMVIGVLKENLKAQKAYEKWGGKLDIYESFYKMKYPVVFYLYDI